MIILKDISGKYKKNELNQNAKNIIFILLSLFLAVFLPNLIVFFVTQETTINSIMYNIYLYLSALTGYYFVFYFVHRKKNRNNYYISANTKNYEEITSENYNTYYLIRYATLFRFFLQRYNIEIKTLSEFDQPKHIKKIDPSILQVFSIPKKHSKSLIKEHWDTYIGFLEQDIRKVAFDKPQEDAPHKETTENIEKEIKGLISLINNDYHIEELFEIAQEFRAAVQQYLLLFKEYIKTTQQEEIQLEAVEYPKGINLRIRLLDADLKPEVVKIWLQEYMEILQQNSDNLKINTSEKTNARDLDILILDLKNQIAHLKNAFEIAQVKNADLKSENTKLQKEKNDWKDVAFNLSKQNNVVNVNTIQNTGKQKNLNQGEDNIIEEE